MIDAGKKPSTVRNAYFIVRQVLRHAVVDGRIDATALDPDHPLAEPFLHGKLRSFKETYGEIDLEDWVPPSANAATGLSSS